MIRMDEARTQRDKRWVIDALRAEGIPAHPGYTTPLATGLPVCERLCRTTIWIKHDILLAGAAEMADVVEAFARVIPSVPDRTAR